MVDRSAGSDVEVRLRAYLTSELRRAEVDYPALPRQPRTRMAVGVPIGVALLAVALIAALLLLRPLLFGVDVQVGGPRLGSDGIPLSIGDEPVLRGSQIATRLQVGGTDPSFLAGGRLVLRTEVCSFPSPPPGQPSAICPATWWVEDVSGPQPSFQLITRTGGPTFVQTSGALTVFRVTDQFRCLACRDVLLVEDVLWRQPTKGPIPPDAVPPAGGAINEALVPDFVSAYGQDGVTIAGYVPKALLLHHSGSVPGSPDNPPQDQALPVYGEDLTTLVGHMVPGKGFVPLSVTPTLPTLASDNGACRGVGLVDATLAGSPADPRVAWLVSAGGGRQEIVWPPGFSARFTPHLEVIDTSGKTVFRAGDKISGGCVAGPPEDPGKLLLIRPGY